jgi:hypothetical protein
MKETTIWSLIPIQTIKEGHTVSEIVLFFLISKSNVTLGARLKAKMKRWMRRLLGKRE